MEDLEELCLSSNVKRYRDDTNVRLTSLLRSKLTISGVDDAHEIKRELKDLFDANQSKPSPEEIKF